MRVLISNSLRKKIVYCSSEKFLDTITQILNNLSKIYDIKIRIMDSARFPYAGTINMNGEFIRISSDCLLNISEMLSTIFHELGHAFCIRNGKWYEYHVHKNKRAMLNTAYKAEIWVDEWAETEMKKYFPKVKYNKLLDDFSPKEIKEYYRNFVLEAMR